MKRGFVILAFLLSFSVMVGGVSGAEKTPFFRGGNLVLFEDNFSDTATLTTKWQTKTEWQIKDGILVAAARDNAEISPKLDPIKWAEIENLAVEIRYRCTNTTRSQYFALDVGQSWLAERFIMTVQASFLNGQHSPSPLRIRDRWKVDGQVVFTDITEGTILASMRQDEWRLLKITIEPSGRLTAYIDGVVLGQGSIGRKPVDIIQMRIMSRFADAPYEFDEVTIYSY